MLHLEKNNLSGCVKKVKKIISNSEQKTKAPPFQGKWSVPIGLRHILTCISKLTQRGN